MLDRLQTESFSIALKMLMGAAFFLMLCTVAWAADVSAQKDGSNDIVAPQENAGKICEKFWNDLWVRVQSKDPQAIEGLFMAVSFGYLMLPKKARKQSVLELAAYVGSLGPDHPLEHAEMGPVAEVKDPYSFWVCIGQREAKYCAEEAIKNGVVPSFQSFVEDINTGLAKGEMPICGEGIPKR